MSSFRKVVKYNGGVKEEAGILIEGQGWRNTPKGCKMLTPDLEGKYVEVEMADLKNDGNYYITELRIEGLPTRYLKDYLPLTKSSNVKEAVDEWFEIYNRLCAKLVPSNPELKDTYLISEARVLSAKAANKIWEQLRQEKQNVRNK